MCAQCECKKTLFRNMKITKQDHDKYTYPKLVLNKLKVMWDSTSNYTHWALSSRKLLKKLPTFMWPMSNTCGN